MKEKRIIYILSVLTIIFTVIGSTLAYYNWETSSSQRTNVVFTTTPNFSCSANGGGDITSEEGITLIPSECSNSNHVIKREINTSVNITSPELTTIYMDLYLTVDSIGSYLINNENFKYTVTTSSTSCTTNIVSEGNFAEVGEKSEIKILDYKSLSQGTTPFYLYIWLDKEETEIPPSDETARSFSLSMSGSCTDRAPQPNAPVLDNTGMIPVTIANDGTVTTVSSNSSSWYNYDNKEWANAILVTSGSRDTYLGTTNVEVDQDDILAYYVWIPRYKYKIWTLTTGSSPQEIDIVFEKTSSTTTGSKVDDYITHPAFDFGGEKLPGFWVAKFEISADSSSTCYQNSASSTNCNNLNQEPRILPKVHALNYIQIGYMFETALKFSGGTLSSDGVVSFGGSSTYGLASTTDSHMMKNREWGAVAYLSHSKYGVNTEIEYNNFWNSTNYWSETGCGATSTATSSVTTCAIPYGGASSYPQSSTGNISGVFDMAGGLYEYTMGNYAKTKGSYFSVLPTDTKYYDIYPSDVFTGTNITNMSLCTLDTCGGHALHETKGWYSDSSVFVNSSNPWFERGGSYNNATIAGAFYSSVSNGIAHYGRGFRSVLLPR